MVISHKHHYVFVELGHTGSTAISQELCELYGGGTILHKHATYGDLLRVASLEEKSYFVLSCIRNPLDNAVTSYFKSRNDHQQTYSSVRERPWFTRLFYQNRTKSFEFIRKYDADFSTYFLKFYRFPYDNWSALSHHQFDYVIRFEKLEEGFSQVLKMIGVEQIRPLPIIHRTGERQRDFHLYYKPETVQRAKHVFGPFMKKWGYEFPPEWGADSVSWMSRFQFSVLGLFRRFYWIYLRSIIYARLFYERGDHSTAEKIRETIR